MIEAYLTDTVTRIRAGAPEAWNEPGASTETDIPAYVKWERRRMVTAAGVEITANGYVLSTEEFLLSDRLRIEGRVHGIIASAPEKSFHATHYKAWVT